jgi:small subunit ribosomal protein S6
MPSVMIRKYEMMTTAPAKIGETKARGVSNSIKDLISESKGKILNSDFMGKKKFAYEIKHETDGFYDLMEFEMDAASLPEFRKKLDFIEDLTRYMVTVS